MFNLQQQMSLRYGKLKDYVKTYTSKTKDYRVRFKNYIKVQRERIVAREREKFRKRVIFWTIFLGGGYFIYDQLYRKQIEISKMNRKLQNLYAKSMVKQDLKEGVHCLTLSPATLDELANMMSLAYKYHYKVIVRMDEITKRQKIIISEQFDNKCVFVNLSALSTTRIDEINNQIYIEAGAKCSQVNMMLSTNGYAPLFPLQFEKQTLYDMIINNLPLNHQQLSQAIINMELISSSGNHFRSAAQNNRYGQIPCLSSLFIGTGGIFAIPTAATLQIHQQTQPTTNQEILRLKVHNVSQKVNALRYFYRIQSSLIDIQVSNMVKDDDKATDSLQSLYILCRDKFLLNGQNSKPCSKTANQHNIPFSQKTQSPANTQSKYNLFFNANNSTFQQFILKFNKQYPYSYSDGLLKIQLNSTPDNQDQYLSIINHVTNNHGIFVWCDIPEILMRIKPSLDSPEVGAGLMSKIVEVREGLDPRNILYAHNRFENYFAKGFFRKLTQYFW